jgi:hypothetical protein
MPRRARMHGSGHRRLLKNSFFSNLLEVCFNDYLPRRRPVKYFFGIYSEAR